MGSASAILGATTHGLNRSKVTHLEFRAQQFGQRWPSYPARPCIRARPAKEREREQAGGHPRT